MEGWLLPPSQFTVTIWRLNLRRLSKKEIVLIFSSQSFLLSFESKKLEECWWCDELLRKFALHTAHACMHNCMFIRSDMRARAYAKMIPANVILFTTREVHVHTCTVTCIHVKYMHIPVEVQTIWTHLIDFLSEKQLAHRAWMRYSFLGKSIELILSRHHLVCFAHFVCLALCALASRFSLIDSRFSFIWSVITFIKDNTRRQLPLN